MIKPLIGRVPAIQPLLGHMALPLYRNGYALILSSTVTSGLGLIYWVLAARYYDAQTVGVNSALISAMLFLSAVAQLNLGGMLLRFLPRAGRAVAPLIGYSYLASFIAALLVGAVFVWGLDVWSPTLRVMKENAPLLIWFMVGLITWSIFTLQDSALTGIRKTMLVPLENGIYAVAKIGLLIFFATQFPAQGIFASWTIPVLFALVPINLLIFRRFLAKRSRAGEAQAVSVSAPEVVKYALGNYVGAIFYQSTTTLLPIMVADRLGATSNAYFYLPWTITVSLQMIALNMSASFTVEAAHDRSNLRAYCRRVLVHNLKILTPIAFALLVGAPYILGIFGREYAAQGSDMLRLFGFSVIPYSLTSIYVGLARVQDRVNRIALVQIMRCVLVLMLSYFALPVLNITGVGLVWLASETLIGGTLFVTQIRPFLQGKSERKRVDATSAQSVLRPGDASTAEHPAHGVN